ncbi:FAD-dependent oxidoreductase [Bariatricus massiliensis]|uniref:FAD-dependent oxidoreductase n=1 Tax=Bariatricus massiliensis TaxID=1745713 RepID=A0ABS8DJ02_9FIRM|nr:FAD-dependent oxidoreductase [Bariatricus massiliensis]MCB7305275.1 FAD-dependent oxidoreductase [Bariatricus massiliensis]MCB7375832.1 FAD-dependent oxidoreductase [Bariatricus massiliensis]MCB7388418.1 FAD-dependent oxidoreductase [Bariatricus massiliensis]MCB7412594.1 FAD-dependent oxidoreductase [Bariatricus massiliensis]MCQ5254768.1 FAD-dependent oxidoreductase [Bariatricus massiliensis]
MKKYTHVIIGFGKGGKTLAAALAAKGESVALIEKSADMYGGTCINVACIPSKYLEGKARFSMARGGSFFDKSIFYKEAVEEKRKLTAALRQKNYDKLIGSSADVLTGMASFIDANHINVSYSDGTSEQIEAEKFYINTGARPFIPDIPGLVESRFVYTSESLMDEEKLPRHLVILGGGYIGLEFASYYINFGAEVTVLQRGNGFLPREDEEAAKYVYDSLVERGVKIVGEAEIEKVEDLEDRAEVAYRSPEGRHVVIADAVLVAAGRRPNVEGLNVEAAGVELDRRGGIKADAYLRTTAPNIWVMGDAAGGQQFTYISLDDSRIVKSQVIGGAERSTENRGAVPYSIFLDPPFSRVGLTEKEAKDKGYHIKVAKLQAQAVPKAQVLEKTTGFMKAVVDADTGRILGAHLFCAESHEIINIIKLAIDADLPYNVFQDGIFTHPTMCEALNDLFGTLR